MKPNIKIFDTTLRDGEQMPGVVFTPEEKIELAVKSAEFGCDIIKTMPCVSKRETLFVKTLSNMGLEAEISAASPLKRELIDLSISCDVQRIILFTVSSDIHLKYKLKISREENLSRTLEMIDYVREHGVTLDFAVEDATRADIEYLTHFIKQVSKYVDFFLPADTLGCMTPFQTFEFYKKLKRVCKCKLGIHCHNDFGLATANVLAALSAGADGFSATFTGIGERAGNAPMEEVCVALKYLCGIDLEVKFEMLTEICRLVEKYSGVRVQKHKPIIGENAFAHESGIHVDGILKNPRTYENFDPGVVGQKRKILFGKHSGSSGLRHVLKEFNPPEEIVKKLLSEIKEISEKEKRALSEEEVKNLFLSRCGGGLVGARVEYS